MGEIDLGSNLETYRRACRAGTRWLLSAANEDGSIGPVRDRLFYYRAPWTLELMGEIAAASRLLDWIREYMFSPRGAFEGISPQGVFEQRYGSYPLACLIVGATLMHRFDIVCPGTQSLCTWQDPDTGGFDNRLGAAPQSREQELFPTCQGGMTLLLVGRIDAARKAGHWVRRLWDLQPNVERELFHVCRPGTGLVTDYADDLKALYVTRKDDPWQHHFNGGIAAAFLCQLHLATGEPDWLDSARKYQEFSMTTDPCQFQSMQTCKSGWGSGLLYVVTRESRYRDWTVRLGDWFVDHQFDDGHWENTKFWTPNPTLADNIDVTVEFVMHLANIIGYLSVGEPPRQ